MSGKERVTVTFNGERAGEIRSYIDEYGYEHDAAAVRDLAVDGLRMNQQRQTLLDSWLFYISMAAALTAITFGVGQLATGWIPLWLSLVAMVLALVLLTWYAVRITSRIGVALPRPLGGA